MTFLKKKLYSFPGAMVQGWGGVDGLLQAGKLARSKAGREQSCASGENRQVIGRREVKGRSAERERRTEVKMWGFNSGFRHVESYTTLENIGI